MENLDLTMISKDLQILLDYNCPDGLHGLSLIDPSAADCYTPREDIDSELIHDLWLAIRDFEEKGTPYLTDELRAEYDKLKKDCRYGLSMKWHSSFFRGIFDDGIKLGNEILELEKKDGGNHSLIRKRNELSDIITKRLIQELEWNMSRGLNYYIKKFVIKTLKDIFNIDGVGLDKTIPGTLVSSDRIKAILQFQDESITSYKGKETLSEPVAMIGLRFGRNLENSPCSFKSQKKAKVKSKYKSYKALRYIQNAGRSYSKEGLISFLKSEISKEEDSYAKKEKETNNWIVDCQNPLVSENLRYVWEQQIVNDRDSLARIKKSLDELKADLDKAS